MTNKSSKVTNVFSVNDNLHGDKVLTLHPKKANIMAQKTHETKSVTFFIAPSLHSLVKQKCAILTEKHITNFHRGANHNLFRFD